MTYDGERIERVALLGVPPAFAEWGRGNPLTKSAALISRGIATRKPVQATDVTTDALLATSPRVRDALVELGGVRALLQVPLLKDGAVVGFIAIFRREPGVFPDKQIALLEGFAAQAVIAMENARLLTEQQEALEQQTATAEVLQVINGSPGNLTPVFDSMLEKAMRLCGAAYGVLRSFDGKHIRVLASCGVPSAYAEYLAQSADAALMAGTALMRALLTRQPAQTLDAKEGVGYKSGNPGGRAIADLGGARTVLHVPLVKDQISVGQFTFYRQEVRSFSDKQIALLENFAAQAVIAMENARLIDEQREALEQQTATAEVLQVINASPGNLAPVFAAVLEKAIRLCESEFGIFNSYDGECFHAVATQGVGHGLAEYLRAPIRSGPGLALHRIAQGENVVHIADITDDDAYRSGDPGRRAVADLGGARSQLMVALRKDGNLLGAINIFRQQVRPFSDRQIALVQNFAEQAVIAMENARLLTEQREALEQQTATSDVLQVINSSLGDLAPVFDAILEKAHRLCGVTHGGLVLRDGETFRAVATHSYSGAFEEQLRQGYRGADNPITRSLIDGARFVHLPDLAQIDHPMVRASFELEGVRTGLYVPLRKDDVLLGMISCTRTEIRPFSDKEIALVENFAAQAVIAMENARLLGELRQRTGDLQESLEYQTAISDVLKVISRSTFDLQPVLETLLGTAARLCDADGGGISLREGNGYRMAANYYSATSEYDAFFRNRLMTVDRGSVTGRTVLEARIIHVTDIMSDPEFTLPAVQLGGARTVLGVPLLRDGVVVGVMILLRKPVLPFTDRQIELVTTFADQAVIAIENVRLVTEQQDALDQQTATAEVLGVINASPGDLAPVFDAMLEKATRLCAADFGILWNFDGELAKAGALHRVPTAYAEMVRAPFRPSPESGPARMMRGEGTFVVADLLELPAYHAGDALVRAIVDLAGARSVVITPLRKDAVTLGAITIYRQEVRPFTEKQIALLENFAAQAVIAMENARLIDEIRTARDDAEATLRELKTAQANLIQAEKMASLGQLTAGIAHEIKNPLNFINNFSDLSVELLGELKETAAPGFALLDADRRAEIDEVVGTLTSNLEKITEHGRRADGIVRGMLEHSRGASGERRAVEINTLVDETLNLAYHGARAQDQSFNITLERDFAAGIPPVEVNPQDLTRVFLNIFSNGFYAAMKRARNGADAGFAPTLNVTTRDAGEAVEIRVRDNGIGIPADIRDKLFQPFFTTKPTGEGTGLGLSITYDIVTQQHGGSIAVDSKVGEYSEFTIRLPRNP